MSEIYAPYYTGGWQSGEVGATPITPEALNHIDGALVDITTKKPDTVIPAANGNVPVLDTKGDLIDSGKQLTLDSLGAVNKDGDTMTGALTVPKQVVKNKTNPALELYDADGKRLGYLNYVSNQGRLCLFQQEAGNDFGEGYLFPRTATGLTASAWYNVLTSKNVKYGSTLPESGTAGDIFFKI